MFVQRILPAILVVIPAAIVATVQASKSAPAVDQCKTKPGLSAARALTGTIASTTWPSGAAGIWV